MAGSLGATPYSVEEEKVTLTAGQKCILQLKVSEVIVNRRSIDKKLRDLFDDPKRCDKLFNIYLKLHTQSQQHFRSKNNGRVITEQADNKVIKLEQFYPLNSQIDLLAPLKDKKESQIQTK